MPPRVSNNLLPIYLRWAGPLLELGYRAGLRLHRSWSSPRRAPLPVICVGNITVGGTGKTPAVMYLARGLVKRGRKPAILMRGYKDQASDEARETTRGLEGLNVPVFIGADRLASAQRAREQGCDVALLDDGFQHWRLARDLDIVLVDATNPFGGGHLLPRGRLREPIEGLARAGAVVVTRADVVPQNELDSLVRSILARTAPAPIAKARHVPTGLRECSGEKGALPLEELRGLRVYPVCGIGNPYAFLRTLQELGAEIDQFVAFDDHCSYDTWEVDSHLVPIAKTIGAKAIVVTEKDAAKLEPILCGVDFPIWALAVDFQLTAGEEALWQRVEAAIKPAS